MVLFIIVENFKKIYLFKPEISLILYDYITFLLRN